MAAFVVKEVVVVVGVGEEVGFGVVVWAVWMVI